MQRKIFYLVIPAFICLCLYSSCMLMMNYVLKVSVNNESWGIVYLTGTSVPAGGSYGYNEEVSLTATATYNCQFDHWEGDLSGNTNPVRLTMNDNKVIRAVFTCSASGVSGKVSAFGGTRGVPGVDITVNNEYLELLHTVSAADGTYSFPGPIRFGQISAAKVGYTFTNDGATLVDTNRFDMNFNIKTFADSFTSASTEWTLPAITSGAVTCTNGKLHFAYTQAGTAALASLMPIQVPAPGTTDYSLNVVVTSASGAKYLGLEVNFGTGYDFYFAIDPVKKEKALLDASTGQPYGNNSYNDWTGCASDWNDTGSNTLTFKMDKDYYYFLLNSTGSSYPINFSAAGDVFLRVDNSGTTTPVTVDFDNVEFEID